MSTGPVQAAATRPADVPVTAVAGRIFPIRVTEAHVCPIPVGATATCATVLVYAMAVISAFFLPVVIPAARIAASIQKVDIIDTANLIEGDFASAARATSIVRFFVILAACIRILVVKATRIIAIVDPIF